MPDTLIKVRALKTVQGENDIYSFFINGQDIFKVAGKRLKSRLIVGTGKYRSFSE